MPELTSFAGHESALPTLGIEQKRALRWVVDRRGKVMESVDIDTMRTADGVLIVDGMRVWDYNLDAGVVDLSNARFMMQYVPFDGWFNVRLDNGGRSLMNAERVAVRHPMSRKAA